MITEAAEARLMRQAVYDQPDVLFDRLTERRRAEVKPFVSTTLLAAYIDKHGQASDRAEALVGRFPLARCGMPNPTGPAVGVRSVARSVGTLHTANSDKLLGRR